MRSLQCTVPLCPSFTQTFVETFLTAYLIGCFHESADQFFCLAPSELAGDPEALREPGNICWYLFVCFFCLFLFYNHYL